MANVRRVHFNEDEIQTQRQELFELRQQNLEQEIAQREKDETVDILLSIAEEDNTIITEYQERIEIARQDRIERQNYLTLNIVVSQLRRRLCIFYHSESGITYTMFMINLIIWINKYMYGKRKFPKSLEEMNLQSKNIEELGSIIIELNSILEKKLSKHFRSNTTNDHILFVCDVLDEFDKFDGIESY